MNQKSPYPIRLLVCTLILLYYLEKLSPWIFVEKSKRHSCCQSTGSSKFKNKISSIVSMEHFPKSLPASPRNRIHRGKKMVGRLSPPTKWLNTLDVRMSRTGSIAQISLFSYSDLPPPANFKQYPDSLLKSGSFFRSLVQLTMALLPIRCCSCIALLITAETSCKSNYNTVKRIKREKNTIQLEV